MAGQRGKEAYLCYQVSWATTCPQLCDLMSCTAEPHKCQPVVNLRWYLQDALTVQNFTTSEEAFAAEDLCNAFRSGDADKITALIKPTSLYMQLDSQVSTASVA